MAFLGCATFEKKKKIPLSSSTLDPDKEGFSVCRKRKSHLFLIKITKKVDKS